ncbi:50S ribosomal protein L6 [bacterium]|nr:50S ribosomal protein L6 [bacterium]
MSRLGKTPIAFDSKVKVDLKDNVLTVKGTNGEMTFQIPPTVKLTLNSDSIKVDADLQTPSGRSISGTVTSIVKNMVHGVTEGFTTVLELVGVGYRAQVQGQKLTLALGYSHPVEYGLHKMVKCEVEGTTRIILKSCDKQVLGQTAAEIRKYRPPEPYKGKGILFAGEQILRKAGKSAKSAS